MMTDRSRLGVEDALFEDEAHVMRQGSRQSDLKESYNKAFGKQVTVGIGFQIVRIHQVDESAETFTLDFDTCARAAARNGRKPLSRSRGTDRRPSAAERTRHAHSRRAGQ